MARCKRCRGGAVIELRRHNTAFCRDCFLDYCRRQVSRAIDDLQMIASGDRVLVAVSGGKDSLAVWQLLRDLGHDADGLHLGLGIGDYSARSTTATEAFAAERGWRLHTIDIPEAYGFDIEHGSRTARRSPCSACGLSKRHLFNKAALDLGYDVVVTGHNLDDEAAVLFGNVLRWSSEYLGRQSPVLDATPGFVKKVKPLVRLTERETAAYCVLSGIDYIVEECPMSAGNRHLGYKEALDTVEERSPGAKAAFYLGFIDRQLPHFAAAAEEERGKLAPCSSCGAPTPDDVCAFCKLVERATAEPVTLGPRRQAPA